MLKTNKIEVIDSNHVNIALLKTESVNMLQNIEIDRRTGDYPHNVILNIGETIKTAPESTGYLNITNNNPDILVTDSYIKKNGDEYPLWYLHQFSKNVYNETLVSRTIKRRLTTGFNIITNLTTDDDTETTEPDAIIKDQITVEYNGVVLSPSQYRVDYKVS